MIDADDRTEEQIKSLYEKGVASLESYSVESLYYNIEIVKRIAIRYSKIIGQDWQVLFDSATSKIIDSFKLHKERLCSRLCEKKVRNSTMSRLPQHKIIAKKGIFELKVDLNEIMMQEEVKFDKFVSEENFDGLLFRYPIRETPVQKMIIKGLGLENKDTYERMVRQLIIDDSETQKFYRDNLLSKLTKLIEQNEIHS